MPKHAYVRIYLSCSKRQRTSKLSRAQNQARTSPPTTSNATTRPSAAKGSSSVSSTGKRASTTKNAVGSIPVYGGQPRGRRVPRDTKDQGNTVLMGMQHAQMSHVPPPIPPHLVAQLQSRGPAATLRPPPAPPPPPSFPLAGYPHFPTPQSIAARLEASTPYSAPKVELPPVPSVVPGPPTGHPTLSFAPRPGDSGTRGITLKVASNPMEVPIEHALKQFMLDRRCAVCSFGIFCRRDVLVRAVMLEFGSVRYFVGQFFISFFASKRHC